MFKTRKIIAIILSLIILPKFLSADTIFLDFTKKTRKNAVVRSVLFPGWGQFFNGKRTKGYIIAGGAILSAAAAYYFFSESDKAYDKYNKIGLITDNSYNDYQNNWNSSQYALMAVGAFWLYGIVDSFFFSGIEEGSGKVQSENKSRHDGVHMYYDKKVNLVYSKSF